MLTVVAGVLRNGSGQILLTERLPGKHLAGTWEFPGGKCESKETPHQALVRELHEELGIIIDVSEPLLSLTHAYPEKTVRLLIREVAAWQGEVHGREGQEIVWASLDDMQVLPMPAADRPIIRVLGLDPHYAITPDPGDFDSENAFVDCWQGLLESGYRLLQLRAHSLDPPALSRIARRCAELAGEFGAVWLLNGPAEIARTVGADGVHLSSAALKSADRRPLPDEFLVGASCHDSDELARAGALNADFVCLSPVLPTASHPDACSLGWEGFESLCDRSPLPVLALGGVGPGDLKTARRYGAYGVAGISGFSS
jgi:8-oxo-dGTP diphosphatase